MQTEWVEPRTLQEAMSLRESIILDIADIQGQLRAREPMKGERLEHEQYIEYKRWRHKAVTALQYKQLYLQKTNNRIQQFRRPQGTLESYGISINKTDEGADTEDGSKIPTLLLVAQRTIIGMARRLGWQITPDEQTALDLLQAYIQSKEEPSQ